MRPWTPKRDTYGEMDHAHERHIHFKVAEQYSICTFVKYIYAGSGQRVTVTYRMNGLSAQH